jgi:3-deoxy-manno-octulosonate cytidylyltransferase (CMP-KDO synthetase)
MKAAAVIPARLGSTRLPEKALLHDTGKFLVQHVWERVKRAQRIARVIVATDHPRIAEAVRSFGGEVAMTSPEHPSGTDRVAEVARTLDEEIVVNVQGDEPQIDAADLDLLVDALERDRDAAIATLATPIRGDAELSSESVVKVVADAGGRALYFSRSVVPHFARAGREPAEAWKHRGVYAFRRATLLELAALAAAPLERLERLEQLRWLHHGHRIRVVATPRDGIGIDTADDYRRFVEQGGVR